MTEPIEIAILREIVLGDPPKPVQTITTTWIDQCMALFPNARGFTKEEAEAHSRVIKKRSTVEEKLF